MLTELEKKQKGEIYDARDPENIISPLKFHHLPRGVIGCY